MKVNDTIADVELLDHQGKPWRLSEQTCQAVVLYFYPKAMTPGCTQQSCNYRDAFADWSVLNCQVFGVSKDPVKKLKQFSDKESLNFPLLSDCDTDVCERFDVWKKKSMFGKSYMGIERSTFILNPKGLVLACWRKVKPSEDVEKVKQWLKQNQK